ncbi:hypothetical protein M0R89_22835 (plasmid) [Halorussus limi]|uniref:Uncharacterized protein n=1 Tax=Halorussus limi TaxID=2938695 RepID=A0A8U0I1S8_9EURY|nr:hypothetical protein [Halorussus limi]UPV77210.1 hypothetical protein M0R89_22835 [Halorussus limi]
MASEDGRAGDIETAQELETEIYTCAVDIFQRQREMYWTRNSIAIFLQATLASALTLSDLDPIFVLVFGVFGTFFSMTWAYINIKAYRTITWWKETILTLEENLSDHSCILGIYSANSEVKESQQEGYLHFLGYRLPVDLPLPILTGLFWSLTFLYGVRLVL